MISSSKYLEAIISGLVSKPAEVRIVETHDEMGVLLTLTVAREDMGPIIGKSGDTAKAIRHLVYVAGVKHSARISIKITEPDGSAYVPKKHQSDAELLADVK